MTTIGIDLGARPRRLWPAALLVLVLAVGSAITPFETLAAEATEATEAAEVSAACVDGYRLVERTDAIAPEAILSTSTRDATLAGGVRLGFGTRAAAIMRRTPDGIRRVASFPLLSDSAFMALSGEPGKTSWAVGYARGWTSVLPLAASRPPKGRWSLVPVPAPPGGGGSLSDVGHTAGGGTWAVGFHLAPRGEQLPWAIRRAGGKWVNVTPDLRPGERGMLSGLSVSRSGGTWTVGWTSRQGRIDAYLARYQSGTWKRVSLPGLDEAALADIVVDSSDEGWAVGYLTTPTGKAPLVLRWDGQEWLVHDPPPTGEGDAILTQLALSDGRVTVAGTAWHADSRSFRALVATLDGDAWTTSILESLPGHSAITAVDGDPSRSGWAAGRATGTGGLVLKTCPSSTGIAEESIADDVEPEASETIMLQAEDVQAPGTAPEPAPDLERVPTVDLARLPGVRARDRARAVGLPTRSKTYGAVVDDFDADGRPDIFLGLHGRGKLYLNEGGRFINSGVDFERGDRHGCASADVDGSGLPDLYCSFGASRGTGIKANQLWLDPAGDDPTLHPLVGGAAEPLGRGRLVTFFDVDLDGRQDLFLGQKPGRADGLPSPNRVYLGTEAGTFAPMRDLDIATDRGAYAVATDDVDLDGREDLLLVHFDERVPEPKSGILLYHNTPTGFQDVTAAYGIESIGERDAELARLDDDGRPDLIQLSADRIRLSLQRNGRFRTVFERRIPKAAALAAGDADGDGDLDIYVLRQKDRKGDRDVLLVNGGDGRSWTAAAMPGAVGGAADEVVAIDHDQNGTTDFLALNGVGSKKGPVQLIAFYPRSPG